MEICLEISVKMRSCQIFCVHFRLQKEVKTPIIINFGAYGAKFGHIKDKWTLPIGVKAEMNADIGSLKLLEPAVV